MLHFFKTDILMNGIHVFRSEPHDSLNHIFEFNLDVINLRRDRIDDGLFF